MHGTIEGDAAPDVEEREYETDEDRGTAQRRRRVEHGVIAALVVVVLAAIALIGFQSGADDKQDRTAERGADAAPATTEAPTTEPVAPTTAPTAADETPAPAAPTEQPAHDEPSPVLEDGRHPVNLTGLDTTGRTLQFDLVQWLTGDDASEYVEAHPDEYPGLYDEIEDLGSYPYDSLVVNDNPRLRTLPLSADPQVVVVFSDGPDYQVFPHTVELAELPAYLDIHGQTIEVEGAISNSVWWLTVHDGEVVALEEQFQS